MCVKHKKKKLHYLISTWKSEDLYVFLLHNTGNFDDDNDAVKLALKFPSSVLSENICRPFLILIHKFVHF
jgi:hypothetical protein